MARALRIAFSSLLPSLVAAGVASADLVATSDQRSLHADYFDPYFSEVRDDFPDVPFAAWQDDIVAGGAYYAEIDSEPIGTTRLAARGDAHGFSETGSARSTYRVDFDVTARADYSLTGDLVQDQVAFSVARLMLWRGAELIFSATTDAATTSIAIAESGTLLPGSYTLLVEAEWFDGFEGTTSPATYDFVLETFAPAVPMTGPLGPLLLGGSLLAIGLVTIRWRWQPGRQ